MRCGVAGTFIDEIGSNQSRYEGGEVKRIVRLLVLIGWDVKSWRHIVVEIRTLIGGNETTVTLEGTVDIVEVLVPAAFPLLSRRKFGVIPFEVPCLARHDASLERLVRSQMLAERRRRSRFGHERQGDSAFLPLRSVSTPMVSAMRSGLCGYSGRGVVRERLPALPGPDGPSGVRVEFSGAVGEPCQFCGRRGS